MSLKGQLEASKQEVRNLKSECLQTETKMETVKEQLEIARNTITSISTSQDELNKSHVLLQCQLELLKQKVAELESPKEQVDDRKTQEENYKEKKTLSKK